MKFHFDQVGRFIAPLQALRDLNDSLHLVFTRSTCRATVVDTAHVSLSFVTWICSSDDVSDATDIHATVRISSILTALALSSETRDPFTISLESSDSDVMGIMLDGDATEVNLRLLTSDGESIDVPSYDQAFRIQLDSHRVRDVFRELSTIGDTVSFSVDADEVTMLTVGDIATARIRLKPVSITNPNSIGPISVSLRYLNSVMKSHGISPVILISIVDGMPLRLEIRSDDVGIVSYIAPKIDDDT